MIVAALFAAAGLVQAEPKANAVESAIHGAVQFYRRGQNDDGSFAEGENGPAITALAVTGMLRSKGAPVTDPMIASAMRYLEKHIQPDGGIYVPGPNRNYPTAIGLLAFVAANKDGKYDDVIKRATEYLKTEQWDEGEGIDATSPKYGGAGYGKKSRPDLSNTAYFLEALESAGVPKEDPAYQRAVRFISRCQNLSGEGANDLPQAGLVNDGGFYYTPAEDYNPGGKSPDGGMRSYASMTYAGLKSFVHAGLSKDDRRVKAAWEWIRNHYSLDENPGLGQMGLYYYYHTFAKALDVLDVETLDTADGGKHDWRKELADTICKKQDKDGSWSNKEPRWMESDGRLVTAYALLALAHVQD